MVDEWPLPQPMKQYPGHILLLSVGRFKPANCARTVWPSGLRRWLQAPGP